MKEIVAQPRLAELDTIDRFEGKRPSPSDYELLVESPVTIRDPSGNIVAIIVNEATKSSKVAFDVFKQYTYPSKARQVATVGETSWVKKLDGTTSNTTQLPPHLAPLTSIYGYMDRASRTPYARACMMNRDAPDDWKKLQPYINSVNDIFAKYAPEKYIIQKCVAEEIPPDWIIGKTAFSTITNNINFSIGYHRDANDLKEGLGVMSHIALGSYRGGELVIPRFRVALALKHRDIVLFDVSQVHGVVPISGAWGRFTRMTCVHYLRENLLRCGDAAYEVDRGKRARSIGKLYDDNEIELAKQRKHRAMALAQSIIDGGPDSMARKIG
jgi:hypothetical protein